VRSLGLQCFLRLPSWIKKEGKGGKKRNGNGVSGMEGKGLEGKRRRGKGSR